MTTRIDLDFAPKSYFQSLSLETKIRSKTTGQLRKEAVVESSRVKFTSPYALKGQITEEEKRAASQIHPSYMGGEFLPNFDQKEIEICRIVLKSTTLDVTSVRVTLSEKTYFYSVIDEYEIFDYDLPIKTSTTPLTTEQMLEQIDNCLIKEHGEGSGDEFQGLMSPVLMKHLNGGRPSRDLVDYISVESAFYPELANYYRSKINNYLLTL